MQVFAEDYLTLRLIRLKRIEEWANKGQGFTFILAKGGSGKYLSGSTAQNLLPGDVFLLNSTGGGKIAVTSDEMVFWCFSACFEHLFPLFASGEICLLQNTTENLKGPKLYAASSSLARECNRLVASAPPQGNVEHRSQMLRVAAAVLSVEFKNARTRRTGYVRPEDHMIQVFEELSPSELLTLSVGEMADKFSCSRRHLNRLFHQHFGCSVASLRMEIRLLKALSLLRNPDVKIINVAEQCGFNHLGLFNACFKRRFGNTPGQWRKGASNGGNPAADLGTDKPSHTNGLCSLASKPDGRGATARKMRSVQKLSDLSRGAGPKLREVIMQNMLNVGNPTGAKSNGGVNFKNGT
jgi:AraC-like DNA-binding protein